MAVQGDKREKASAAALAGGGRRRGHPLLRGWRRDRYTHGMHPAQMEALRAMCGALIPSLPGDGGRGDPPGGKDLERFYLASAADSTIPDEVAELMVTRCIREAVALAWVVLWVLSTRVGTLMLCGRLCVSGEFPYVRKFADMPPEPREAALQRWNRVRWLFPLRIAFAIVKILCHYVFYAMHWDLSHLEQPFSEDEVWNVIKSLPADKAPGSDGFTAEFSAWPIIKVDVMAAVNAFLSTRQAGFHYLNGTLITLLPKKTDPKAASDYRPISLIHSFAKLLATRLAPEMEAMVNLNQSAFVKGRTIHDNFKFVEQAAKLLKRKKKPSLLLKLDIAKAFDTVSWPFLLQLLRTMGFGSR